MVRFILPYLLKDSCKRLLQEAKSEIQKYHLIVKLLKRETDVCVTLRTWSRFSVVISAAMRFFRNTAKGTSKTSFLKAYVFQS